MSIIRAVGSLVNPNQKGEVMAQGKDQKDQSQKRKEDQHDREWVDFKLIKQAVTMEMVLDHYQINGLRKNNDELRGRCPIHTGEGERSFHVNLSKGVYNCFSCRAHGNCLDLVAALEKCSIREAGVKMKEWFGVGVGESSPTKSVSHSSKAALAVTQPKPKSESRKVNEGVINPVLGFELRIDSLHPYGLSRGLSKETLEHFGAGFCLSKGMFSGRFVVPLHNEKGQLVGYAGRSIDDSEPRYLFPSNDKGFFKSHLLFNLHRAIKQAGSCEPVVVVEGFFDSMCLHQAGVPAVGLFGSSLSVQQEALLVEHFNKVILLFDGDEAGRSASWNCFARLTGRIEVEALSLPDGVQPDMLSSEDIQQLLSKVAAQG